VVRRLLSECQLPLELSVSATTRAPRAGERHGEHYHFLSREDFAQRRAAGAFLECKEVYGRGDWYGTLREVVARGLAKGKWMVLEIDVEGAMAVLEEYPQAITVFVHGGSLAELERRLRERGTDSDEAIERRLEVARRELEYLPRYRHEVVNGTVEQAVAEVCRVLHEEAQRGHETS
jgi:guanylate kinase